MRIVTTGVYTDGEWIDTLASKKVTNSSWIAEFTTAVAMTNRSLLLQGVRKRKATAFPETTSQLEPENYQVTVN